MQKIYDDLNIKLRDSYRDRRKVLEEGRGAEWDQKWKAHYAKEYDEEVAAVWGG